MLRKIAIVLLIGLVAIQFFHPRKNKSTEAQPNYIGNTFPVPADVKAILGKACNDCHSNNTRYPWYTNIQPVHWFMDNHIRDGKKEMNLDEYTNKPLRFQYHKMDDLIEQVKENKMPISSYLWIHKDAKLTQEEKNKLLNWAVSVQDSLKAHYPADSLIRKKPPTAK
jgi:hypothetical protein